MTKTPTVAEFYGESPTPRIIGTESECNIQTQGVNPIGYISSEAIEASGHKSVLGFFDNGMRIYTDASHLEVATAESLGPRQAAASDLAGVLSLVGVVRASGLSHRGLHRYAGIIIKDRQSTSGYHENFLIPRSISDSGLFAKVVASHLTSRIWDNAGTVGINGFELSQKMSGIGDPPVSHDSGRRLTHGYKPMAMLPTPDWDRDTLGNNHEWGRLEVRFADPGFSPTKRYLGLAATSLVLRLVEHPDLVDTNKLLDFSFNQYTSSAQRFNSDLSFSATATTINGSQITAINYQEMLAQACLDLSKKIDLPQDEVDAIPIWLDICDRVARADFNSGEYAGLLNLLDVAARHRYLARRFSPRELHSHNAAAVEANLTWDRVLPAGGGMRYWSKIPSSHSDSAEVEELLWTPPHTRANIRGSMVAKHSDRIRQINWSSLTDDETNIRLNDPYKATF